jgi:phosphate transport system substrate-binding protein
MPPFLRSLPGLLGFALALIPAAGAATGLDPRLPPYVAPAQPIEGSLHSAGSDTMDVITFGWIQLFRRYCPRVHVTMEARSSLTALPALTAGAAEIGPMARQAPDQDTQAFVAKFGYQPLVLRVGGGAFDRIEHSHSIAIFVHRSNPLSGLTLAQLDALFSSTRLRGEPADLRTWGQLGLGGAWRDAPVHLYAVRRPNGIADAFRHIVLLGGKFKPTIRERDSRPEIRVLDAVVAAVAADSQGICFAGFHQQTPEVKPLAIARTAAGPWVRGALESVTDQSYPLTRFIYIAVNKPPGRPLSPPVREFLRLVLSDQGQRIIAEEGYFLPLPAPVVAEERAKLES